MFGKNHNYVERFKQFQDIIFQALFVSDRYISTNMKTHDEYNTKK